MSTVWAFVQKAFKWISNHLKLFLLIVCVIVFSILIFWWGRKNAKIRALENSLAILNARLKLQGLEIKYDADMKDLAKLKETDKKIDEDIAKVEKSLEEKLTPSMTADEIIAKFKEIGIR